mgnify:CR=1 FL=1
MEGGSCVNTQTGSQSNIVLLPILIKMESEQIQPPVDGEVVFKSGQKGSSCVTTQTGSQSNIVLKPNLLVDLVSVGPKLRPAREVRKSVAELSSRYDGVGQCGKCSRLRSVRCGECTLKMKSANSGESVVRQFPKQSVTLTTSNTHHKGGRSGTSSTISEVTAISKTKKMVDVLSSPSNISPTISSKFGKLYFAGKEGRGINHIINATPTKRKLLIEKQVSKLVPVFESSTLPGSLSRETGESESPAKKLKLGSTPS